jgi:hypothetical protein
MTRRSGSSDDIFPAKAWNAFEVYLYLVTARAMMG